MTYHISSHLNKILDIARYSDIPILITGKHGIGKSEFLTEYSQNNGLELTIIDLSLMDPTDLTGIPIIHENKTHYATPSLLPDSHSLRPHMIVLEELNRCSLSMRQPCLQLLTARKLNDYKLPKNTFLVACMNPSEDNYDVDELDPALKSRFLSINVTPSVFSWLKWAKQKNVHPAVRDFIEGIPNAFDHVPPRTWFYLSTLLENMEREQFRNWEIRKIITSVIGNPASGLFYFYYKNKTWEENIISGFDIISQPNLFTDYIHKLIENHRMDVLSFLAKDIEHALHKQIPPHYAELEELLQLFPADLREPLLISLRA